MDEEYTSAPKDGGRAGVRSYRMIEEKLNLESRSLRRLGRRVADMEADIREIRSDFSRSEKLIRAILAGLNEKARSQ